MVALGAAIAAFYFLVLAPKREEVAKLDTEIAAQEAEVEQARLTLAGYEQAKKTYKRNYATLARLGKAVPADDDVRSLMVQLEATADRSGVDFEKIELGTGLGGAPAPTTAAPPAAGQLASAPGAIPVAGGVLSAMPFTFSFTGCYFDLTAFFARLERFVSLEQRAARLDGPPAAPGEHLDHARRRSASRTCRREINAATYLVPAGPGRRPTARRRAHAGRRHDAGHDPAHDHRRDHRSLPMNAVTTTWRQLVRRRLWPVALLLLAALVGRPAAARPRARAGRSRSLRSP